MSVDFDISNYSNFNLKLMINSTRQAIELINNKTQIYNIYNRNNQAQHINEMKRWKHNIKPKICSFNSLHTIKESFRLKLWLHNVNLRPILKIFSLLELELSQKRQSCFFWRKLCNNRRYLNDISMIHA